MEMEMDDFDFEFESLVCGTEDEYSQGNFPEEEEEEEPQKQQQPPKKLSAPPQQHTIPTNTVPDNQINKKKRHPSPLREEEVSPSDGKRIRSEPSEPESDTAKPPPQAENIDVEPVVIDVEPVVEEKYLSRFVSEIDGPCFPITGSSGYRVYAKISYVDTPVSKKLHIRGYSTGLIAEPISTLIEKLEQEDLRKVQESLRKEEDIRKALEAGSESANNLIHHEMPEASEKLWVDKYSPSSFIELLSDEQTNREVLLWLKQWDCCVFGSQIRSTPDDVLSNLKRHTSLSQHKKLSGVNFNSKAGNVSVPNKTFRNPDNLDKGTSIPKSFEWLSNKKSRGTGPPEQKVLLLCGPPGLGKTTLAHVAAKHCGYHVVEINASDDRSASAIEAKILDVVQMNSIELKGAPTKPKCLVIDEIDGALGEGKGAVEVILKMVASDKKFEVGRVNDAEVGQAGKVTSKQRKKAASLSRPIICICNDLYAPVLRPLRQVAKVHVFVQPTINRVVSRLKYICNKERFKTSSIGLTALASDTECDIRSCLNTLQFLNKKKENLNVLEISSQVVGRKDSSKSAFDVWKEIFQKRKTKQERKSISSCNSDFDVIHSLISNRGEYELTMDGIHENILELHYLDPMMHKTVKCLNLLGVSDHLHRYIMRTQQMSLFAYQPSTAVAIRCLVAQIQKPNIKWPKSFYRYRTTYAEKKDLLRCWHSRISPSLSRHLSTESFVEDSISPLLLILSPPTLRPVAIHSQSEREKDSLSQLVDTMVSYSMTYKKAKPEFVPNTPWHEVAEASTLTFDPPIDEFIKFQGNHYGHSGFPLAMKQVLMHEVEKKKILRESISRSLPSSKNLPVPCSRGSLEGGVKPKAPDVAKKPSGGSARFFDRFIKAGNKGYQNANQSMQKQATMERDSRPLLFKFNEGYTNAVKRPVRVRDLLLS